MKVPGEPIAMPTVPWANAAHTPSVRFVLPGFDSVTWYLFDRSTMYCRVCTFFGLLIVHLLPDFQFPPLPHIQIDHSAWASSAPSGRPEPPVPLPSACSFWASARSWAKVFGGAAMCAFLNRSLL